MSQQREDPFTWKVVPMGISGDRPYAEPMKMTEVEAYLYEAIATLEYIGHPVTKAEIAAVADLDDTTIDRALHDMIGQGLLVQGDYGGEPAYEPARRDWSVAPDKAQGRVL